VKCGASHAPRGFGRGHLQLAGNDPDADALIGRLYRDTLGGYWPSERRHVETGYRNIPFPFDKIEVPVIRHQADWSLPQLLGYFDSWSAMAAYRKQTGSDPLDAGRAELLAA